MPDTLRRLRADVGDLTLRACELGPTDMLLQTALQTADREALQRALAMQAAEHSDAMRLLQTSASSLRDQLLESQENAQTLSNELQVAPLGRCLQSAPSSHWPSLKMCCR